MTRGPYAQMTDGLRDLVQAAICAGEADAAVDRAHRLWQQTPDNSPEEEAAYKQLELLATDWALRQP